MECIACGAAEFSTWASVGELRIMRCLRCGLGVTVPRPSPEQLARNNAGTYSAAAREEMYSLRSAELAVRYVRQLEAIKRFSGGKRLLDVGCSIGMFMRAAAAAGFDASGVEMNAGCAAYGREKFGLDIKDGSIGTADLPDGAFDVVTMFDVLEHVPDPRAFILAARRALKPGGVIAVQSPNIASLMAALARGGWGWLTPLDHLYHFTPEAASRLFASCGFRVLRLSTWEPPGEFRANIYSGVEARGAAGRALRKLLWLAALPAVPLLQRAWWRAGLGGLVEIYAVRE